MASKAVAFSAFVFKSLLTGDCLPNSQNFHLPWLKHLGMDHVENTASKSTIIVASRN
jgi:hypothetical protein